MADIKNIKTKVSFGKDVREKLLVGVNVMADAVGSTLGPRGNNVGIEKYVLTGETYARDIIHDGVSVARSIDLADHIENFGAQVLKEAAQKQVDEVGDGTTVVMILAQALIAECMQLIATGINPMSLRKGLETGCKRLTDKLEELSVPIEGLKDLQFIATISAEDEELGTLVAETLDKVGKDGIVTVETSKSPDTTVEHQQGMQFDKGYLNPYFVTNPDRLESVLEDAYVLVTDKSITTLSEFAGFLNSFVKQSKNLVIISPDISGEALPLLIQNKLQGKLNTLCIQAPSFGEDQKNLLQDIAIVTGAKFFSSDAGYKFEDLKIEDLGFAESVTSTKDETILVGGKGKKEEIELRIASIKKALESADSDFERERMRARLGKLTNGVAVIRVGGQTEVEMKERRERVLDAVAASRAALDKGIVPGGEMIYLHIRKDLDLSVLTDKILYKALAKPFQKLISNADLSEVDMALALNGKGFSFGIDVTTGEVKDLVKEGIVDPVLVSINALRNAVSVAVQIISTGCIIVPEIQK